MIALCIVFFVALVGMLSFLLLFALGFNWLLDSTMKEYRREQQIPFLARCAEIKHELDNGEDE